jgi:hypothetical protein
MGGERYIMIVEAFFPFEDGSTLFLGTVDPQWNCLLPATAEIQIGGRAIGQVRLTEERMPGPAQRGRRSLVTRDPVDHDALREGACVLACHT